MSDAMERINLNVPKDVRRQLRRIAKGEGRSEAEVARGLLIDALERARRQEFYRAVAEAHTDELAVRDLEILQAFESLDD